MTYQSCHYYSKIPRDLTQGSPTGTWMSIFAIFCMSMLFVLEFNSYLTSDISSSVVMDEDQSSTLPINFNITFPRLSCQHASLDVSNVMGVHQVIDTNYIFINCGLNYIIF